MKKAVVFYSLEGNAKLVAETIAKETGADMLQLKPVKDITNKGFMKYLVAGSQVMRKKKPDLQPIGKNLNDYDMLYIGTPVWAGNYTPALRTFFNDYKLKGKKIALFCCCGGGKGKTFEEMRKELDGNAVLGELELKNPLKSNNNDTVNKVKEWVKTVEKSK